METNLSPYTYQFRAMGSQIQLWLEYPDPDEIEQVFTSVQEYFNEVERALSRFQPASELTLLNGRSGQWVAISPLLWDVISEALALATLTDGLYDPTLLNALEAEA